MAMMNRLANVKNPFQGPYKKVLCVCSAGLLRSPTAAYVLSNSPFGFNTRAVGTSDEYALIPIDEAHIWWSDHIVVMDHIQETVVADMVKQFGLKRPISNFNIPDEYEYRNPDLVELIEIKGKEIFLYG